MAHEIVVGTYDSRDQAEHAREQLIAQGVPADRIIIEAGPPPDVASSDRGAARAVDEPLPEDRGVAGFIGRMFSGALMDDANIEKYTQDLHGGRIIVAVRVESEERRNVASTILARGGPRVYSLRNAPTAWNEASDNDPASIGGVDEDPARPEGLLGKVEGLPVGADEARLEKLRQRRPR